MCLDDFEDMLPDRPRDEKWELIGGRVVRMPLRTRLEHSLICTNVHLALFAHIRANGLECTAFRETFWLKHQSHHLAVLPDVHLHRGTLKPGQNSIDDPVILIEVVSKGSEYRDRFEKASIYSRLPSVLHIAFIRMERPDVEVMTRRDADHWEVRNLTGDAALLGFQAISFEMPLTEIYRGVLDPAG